MDLSSRRSPGMKLLFVALVAAALTIPLMTVYALVWDRQEQSDTARSAITRGWGASQVVTGPVLVIPYRETASERVVTDGRAVERVSEVERSLYLSPDRQEVVTRIVPRTKHKSIYQSVIYRAAMGGEAQFSLPDDLERQGFERSRMMLDRAYLSFGVSDPRGLEADSKVNVNGDPRPARPGGGPGATGNAGFSVFVDWSGERPLVVDWSYGLRGSETLSFLPRGAETRWQVRSSWPHPSFSGSFLPSDPSISDEGFVASYAVPDLALGQDLLTRADPAPPIMDGRGRFMAEPAMVDRDGARPGGPSMAASVGLVEPVDLYSRIDRSVKYGFLIIGFTFLAYFLFDVVGGARVAAAEYLLTGAGLVLFFVLLLALAEVVGFSFAYLLASAAIIGLLTAYGAAVLKSWRRARFMGALLVGLYALLYTLLSLEAWSLLIGSVLLFAALAGVMYATRRVDWSGVGRREEAAD